MRDAQKAYPSLLRHNLYPCLGTSKERKHFFQSIFPNMEPLFDLYSIVSQPHIIILSSLCQVKNKTKKQLHFCNCSRSPYGVCVGVDLSFRAASSRVLWAQTSLTSVFGMGTGGPSLLKTPTVIGLPISKNILKVNRRKLISKAKVVQALGRLVSLS